VFPVAGAACIPDIDIPEIGGGELCTTPAACLSCAPLPSAEIKSKFAPTTVTNIFIILSPV
jgi:hypothetical protein